MIVITAPTGYRVINAKEAENRFAVSRDVEYPYQEFADEQEIRVYEGGLHVAGTFTGEPDVDWQPYNTIVDGDLIVDDVFDWFEGYGNFVLVTGDLRARHVSLDGCPTVVVRGDLLVSGGIQAQRGHDGGFLTVRGRTAAGIIISTLYFNLHFDHQPEALLIADPYRTNCPVDLTDDDLAEAARPELLDDDGRPDEGRIEQALRDGRPILRADVRPSHLAALAELDALLPRAAEVTELDLADRKLREFPEQVFAFGNLRTLSLSGNDLIRRIPKRIAALGALEELDLSGLRLRRLPRAIGRLTNLHTLNISGNRFRALPDELGDLTRLRVLHAEDLRCPVPASLGRLTELAEVNLAGLRPPKGPRKGAGKGVGAPFPVAVTTLPRLRTLDLSRSVLDEVPAALLHVTTIEELRLDGALGRVERLPKLAQLPRLRVLRMDGRSGNTGRYPPHHLLDAVWSISSLTELGIDQWGAQADARPPLTRLPDEAFAGMPGLRVLDLSRNELTELPESFYRLSRLESVNLCHTMLDSATLDRLGAVFPRVRMDLRHVPTRQDATDPVWQEVHERVLAGAAELTGDSERAVAEFEEALRLCMPGARYSDHDRLYALYGLVDALSVLVNEAPEEARPDIVDKRIGYAEQALALLPDSIWHFTEEGAFQEEVQRRVGNLLAWHLMERGETGRALSIVERALTVAEGSEYDFVRDTQVRILLAAGRRDEAYRVVDRVLTRAPDFADFADLRADPDFQPWRGGH